MGHLGSDGKPFSPEETERLEVALVSVLGSLTSRADLTLPPSFLQNIHVRLSAGLYRMQPGQFRRQDITFGSFMGTPPQRITADLLALEQCHNDVLPELETFTLDALYHATWVHAELIRIHPFWDGNGRLARAVQAWLCWRLGIAPPMYSDRSAYLAGLNRYHHTRDLSLLMDLTRAAQEHTAT